MTSTAYLYNAYIFREQPLTLIKSWSMACSFTSMCNWSFRESVKVKHYQDLIRQFISLLKFEERDWWFQQNGEQQIIPQTQHSKCSKNFWWSHYFTKYVASPINGLHTLGKPNKILGHVFKNYSSNCSLSSIKEAEKSTHSSPKEVVICNICHNHNCNVLYVTFRSHCHTGWL